MDKKVMMFFALFAVVLISLSGVVSAGGGQVTNQHNTEEHIEIQPGINSDTGVGEDIDPERNQDKEYYL